MGISDKLYDHLNYEGKEVYHPIDLILDALVAFLFTITVFFAVKSFDSTAQAGVVSQVTLSVITATMALAIYRQVVREGNYLENFEPSLQILNAQRTQLRKEYEPNSPPIQITLDVGNDSQTLSVIKNVEIPKFPEAEVRVEGYDVARDSNPSRPGGADYFATVPVEPNQMLNLHIYVKGDSIGIEGDKFSDLLDNERLKVVLEGTFGEEAIQVDFSENDIEEPSTGWVL